MTLRHMRIFVSVYQQKSITKASNRLHLAQPSVSLAISELETYYGIRLFDRISRRLYVTEQGKQFYDYALHIVSLFDEMEQGVRNWDSIGTLRVGSSITIGNYLLPSLVTQFQKDSPNIKVQVLIKNSADVEQAVIDNVIDFALIEGTPKSPQITSLPFMDDRLCLIASPSHPLYEKKEVCIHDLLQYDFLLREKGSAGRDILENLFSLHNLTINPLWESVSTKAIVTAVSQGLGISILPYLLVEQDLKDKKIIEIPVSDMSLSRKFHIIYHKNKYLTTSAKAFMALCKNP